MKKYIILVGMIFSVVGFSQEKEKEQKEKKAAIEFPTKQLLREGNDLYKQQNYTEAEANYIKALTENPNYEKANYNLGNAIYQQNRFKEALPMYELASKLTEDKLTKAESFHNMGNSFMKEKQYQQAVDAYKNSLRNNSKDDETRYNLAIAQKLLEKEQQKEKPDDKDKKDKDKKENDKKEEDKDKKDKEKDNKDKDKDKDKNGDNKDDNKDKGKDKDDNKGDKDKKQPPKQPKLTPQQVQQLLEAMNKEENKTQKKVNAKKAKGRKVKNEKDW